MLVSGHPYFQDAACVVVYVIPLPKAILSSVYMWSPLSLVPRPPAKFGLDKDIQVPSNLVALGPHTSNPFTGALGMARGSKLEGS